MNRHQEWDQSGFTLIELIVSAAMMVVITGVAVALLVSALNKQPEVTKRADQIGIARNAIEKLTADIRQGRSANLTSPSELTLETLCDEPGPGAVDCTLAIACGPEPGAVPTTYRCTRTREFSEEPTTTVVSGLANPEVFEVEGEPEPRYVGVTIELPASDRSNTVLEDGAALHNNPYVLEG